MNTIPELLDYLRTHKDMAEMLAMVERFQLSKTYVNDRVPDIHLVKTFDKASKRWSVGLFSVELSLDKRSLIDVRKAGAPQLIGRVVGISIS
jgi:hypothetical protein